MRIVRYFLTALLFFVSNLAQANFDAQTANKTLDKLSLELSVVDVKAENLEQAILTLKGLQEKANACVSDAQQEINNLDTQLQSVQQEAQKNDSTVKFLKDKKSQQSKLRTGCQLFVLRSTEAIKVFTEALEKFETKQRLSIADPIWISLINSTDFFQQPHKHLSSEDLKQAFGGTVIVDHRWTALSLLLLILCLGYVLKRYFSRDLPNIDESDQLTVKMQQVASHILAKDIMSLVVLLFLCVATTVLLLLDKVSIELLILSLLPLSYLVFSMSVDFFVYFKPQENALNFVPLAVAKPLARVLKSMGLVAVLGAAVYLLIQSQTLPDSVNIVLRTLFITTMASTIFIFFVILTRIDWIRHSVLLRSIALLLLSMAMLSLLALEWIGYHSLIDYIGSGVVISFSVTLGIWMLYTSALTLLQAVNEVGKPWQNKIRRFFGFSKTAIIPELIWFRLVITLILWGGLGLILARIWFLNEVEYDTVIDGLFNGFSLSGIHIIPIRIIYALVIFGFLSLLTRFYRRYMAMQTSSGSARGMQNSMAALIGYIGFSIAILVALLIAGINLSGLALVAGALSVGIGFGLQNIVNNFVSGLILLVERPIKPGDRVLVGEYEGHVKSISIRSTVIHSLDRTDIILPNSDLISGKVVNLMLDDQRYRLQIYVGVAYGSDTDLVKTILLDIACQHPEVINDDEIQPMILFNEFGDSSLNFEVRVIIEDVNRRQRVRSELHYAIDNAFREHHIEIPFPQRDIWVKQFPQQNSNLKDG